MVCLLSPQLAPKGSRLPLAKEETIRVVMAFMDDRKVTGDKTGFLTRTIASIVSSLSAGSSYDFWYVEENNRVLAYCLAEFGPSQDGSKTYYLNQAWLDKSIRHTGLFQSWMYEIIASAKERGAKHISILTDRNPKAYCRFLGKKWRHTTSILELKDN